MREEKRTNRMNDYIRGIVMNLPEGPGVYQYLNEKGTIIYVGKAKNLKRRVYSYFSKEHGANAIIIGIIIIAGLLIYLSPKIQKNPKFRVSARALNTAVICSMMLVIGYSSYALIVIRSVANPPMDQNSPEDIFTLGDYLGREQYGTRPLFYGPAFSSRVKFAQEGDYLKPVEESSEKKWIRKEKTSPDEKDSYISVPGETSYAYEQNMINHKLRNNTNGLSPILHYRISSCCHQAKLSATVHQRKLFLPY